MKIEEHVPLSLLTTLRVGGNARYVISCSTEGELREAVAFAKGKQLPFYILGGGSNLLAGDHGYRGVLIRPLFDELSLSFEGDVATLVAGAHVVWDDVVRCAAEEGLWGIENLAGIPGTVGGAPIQNIGAYGTELAETLLHVDTYDARNDAIIRVTPESAAFGYRDSCFKRDPSLVVLRVALRLFKKGAPKTTYKDLAAYAKQHPLATPADVGEAVRSIRSRKFPDLAVSGTAGSFFKNPVISKETYESLKKTYPDLPGFPQGEDVKIPLAWILDNVLSLRGFSHGRVRLFEQQPLVIVTEEGATAKEINELADTIAKRVEEATGIVLEREVRTLSEN